MWYCDCPQCNGTIADYSPFYNAEEYALWEYLEDTEETRYPDEDYYEDITDDPILTYTLRLDYIESIVKEIVDNARSGA